MKKSLKIILIVLLSILIFVFALSFYFFILTNNVDFDESKLQNTCPIITYYDVDNNIISEELNGIVLNENDEIMSHTKNAFIAIEDKRFYKHNGIDYRGLLRASFNNLKSLSFKEGASTITQQLIKNTHLSNEKTLKRKIAEIKLAKQLEKKLSKEEIIRTYLNTIYFGDGCYGISSAAKHYFNKKTSELDINESAALAGIIKAPSNYSPFSNYKKCNERKNIVLKEMYSQNYISKEEYENNSSKNITLVDSAIEKEYTLLSLIRSKINSIIEKSPYENSHLNVYTFLDAKAQEILKNNLQNSDLDCDKSAVILSKDGKVRAYFSTCGELYRQAGSTLKPIAVYAPAIEMDAVASASLILDEKTDFNGYSPSNYNDKYYGYISVKDSLAKSLNVCSVKILNYVGAENALNYLRKTQIQVANNDSNLSLALGSTSQGATLIQIAAAYNIFNNNGKYPEISIIDKITTDKNRTIYEENKKETKVFSQATIDIMNDMMQSTVISGTAKKLSFCDIPLYAKTGTVGSKEGNTDAYSISYNTNYTLGVWFGNSDNSLLSNSTTGGNQPTIHAANIWSEIYKDKTPPDYIKKSDDVEEILIDSISYNDDKVIVLADDLCPKRYALKTLFKKSAIPKVKSDRFSHPKIKEPKLLIFNNGFKIELCLTEYQEALIYKQCNNNKELVYDTLNNNKFEFYDKDVTANTEYQYSIIPYFINDEKKILGEEIFLDKVKSPAANAPDDNWWIKED